MVRTAACAYPRSRSASSVAGWLALAGALIATPRAFAADRVRIAYAEAELQPVAERIASELGTDGYAVELGANDEPSPCDKPLAAGTASDGAAEAAWVRLSLDPNDDGAVVASICVRSTVALLERVASRGERAEPERFALATAEALNGLRAKVPVLSSRRAPDAATPTPERASRSEGVSHDAPGPGSNQLSLTQTALLDLAELPPLWGGALAAELALNAGVRIAFDTFIPISSVELANQDARVTLRAAWVRTGVSLGWVAADARVGAALLAGPALTWASAEARAPRIGAADAKLGALLTLAATIEYPSRSRVFLLGAARASGLFPAVRVAVASDTSKALGPLLAEASLGVGVRFGPDF